MMNDLWTTCGKQGWRVGSSNPQVGLIQPVRKNVLGKTAGHSKMDHPPLGNAFQGRVGTLQPSNPGRAILYRTRRAALAEARHTTTEEAT